MGHLLTLAQQQRLKDAACIPTKGAVNDILNAEIAALHKVNAKAFLNDLTLKTRNFYHEPSTSIPYKSYIVPYAKKF